MPILEPLAKEESRALSEVLKLTAEQILAIPEKQPTQLFKLLNKSYVSATYKKLALIWHPDRKKDPSGRVFTHIGALFNNAIKPTASKEAKSAETDLSWHDNSLYMKTLTGKKFIFPYIKTEEFELGTMVLTQDTIIYLVRREFQDLFDNAVNVIKGFQFPFDVGMKKDLQSCLPEIAATHAMKDFNVLIIKKDPALIRLRDLLDFLPLKGKLEAYHTAWILSRLHNIACYLGWAKLSHQAISLESCFVEPVGHSFALLGGWWYARPLGEKVLGLPGNLTNFMPEAVKTGTAEPASDFSLIRRVCLQLLGNQRGLGYFAYSGDVPAPMLEWLRNTNKKSAISQYKEWKDNIRRKRSVKGRVGNLAN